MKRAIVLLILLGISLLFNGFFFLDSFTGQAVQDLEPVALSVYTEAVCEAEEVGQRCHDEVFLVCGETVTTLGTVVGNNPYFEATAFE